MNANGFEISIDAIDNYITLMCKAFCLYQCLRYDVKGKEILKTNGKYFAIDFGIRRKLVPNTHIDTGKILENFVYLELIKKGYRVFIGKVGRDYEIDFVAIKNDMPIYVQVSESINSLETREREIRPFKNLKDNYARYLVTLDEIKFSFDECTQINLFDFIKLI